MHPREICCCFSGHRPNRLPWGSRESDERCLDLKGTLADTLEDLYGRGFRHFICGMAQGCDFYFAEAVLALRELHPDVTLEAAIPCATQADRWPAVDRERYVELLVRCDEQHLIQQAYSPNCMQRRNQYMVDHSALLLAAFAGLPGGTMNTILYAQRSGVETVVIGI
ncbi:MAG: SLOG family protein [Candidatus Limivicinus sp.]|nr:SLOG family protein [Candidatus Limivicinus sp.]